MPTGGQIQNIAQLIATNERLVVPDFQRNYSWELSQVDDLYRDISLTTANQDSHFLGSVILLREQAQGSPGELEIVDGQQRLTTIFVLVAAIRDIAVSLPIDQVPGVENGAPLNPAFSAQSILGIQDSEGRTFSRFVAHPMIASTVETSVFPYPTNARPKLKGKDFKYTLALRKAVKRLNELVSTDLAELQDDEERVKHLYRLLETIKHRLKILNVHSDSSSEAYEIFMTLNSRGLPLGPSDLVKSEIFKHLTKGLVGSELDAKTATLTSEWKSILTNLDDGDVDQFLRHYMVSLLGSQLTSKKVFEKVRDFINKEGVGPVEQSQKLFKELLINSKIYKYLLDCDSPDIQGEEPSLQLLKEVSASYRIFGLVVLDSRIALKKEERVELLRLCEVVVLRWVLAGENAQVLENNLASQSKDLRDGVGYSTVAAKLKTWVKDDDTVARRFSEPVEDPSLVRAVLYRINKRWDVNHMIGFDPKKMHVEHIAPDTANSHWLDVLVPDASGPERLVEYENITEFWGNKTILDAKINQEVKQKPFSVKREGFDELLANGTTKHHKGYKDSPLDVTSDLANQQGEWSRELIHLRGDWILECFLKIWSNESKPESVRTFSQWLQARSEQ